MLGQTWKKLAISYNSNEKKAINNFSHSFNNYLLTNSKIEVGTSYSIIYKVHTTKTVDLTYTGFNLREIKTVNGT